MGTSYLPYFPEQPALLPSNPADWLPNGHLAYFIHEAVDQLDLRAFHAPYLKGGPRNQPFHPVVMVKILIYGYATGVFSSRKMARKLHEDVPFRVLAANNFPAHRTICDFRQRHFDDLAALFAQVVRLARELGFVKLGTIAVDGTKVKANASRHKAMSYERMCAAEAELDQKIKALLEKANRIDEQEADEPDLDIPAELERREDRLKAIQAAKKRLEERQQAHDSENGRTPDDECRRWHDDGATPRPGRKFKREFGVPDPTEQESFTDFDSRIMPRSGGGFDYAYNGQLAVDEDFHIIVAAELTNCAADCGELEIMLHAVHQNLDANAECVLADAGYRNEQIFANLANHPTEVYVALNRKNDNGKEIDSNLYPHTVAMQSKIQTADGQRRYRKRKWISEPPNGWMKNILGFRQFSVRGFQKVQAEWKLVTLALNLRRMANFRTAAMG